MNLVVDGQPVDVDDEQATLLEVLREQLGCVSAKDGCSPQGQCGCCTVWVDGSARAACVTPVRRVAGRRITTIDGLDEEQRTRWVEAFVGAGASQCGFCTPGIVMRLAALEGRGPVPESRVRTALAAHLCRCTGWQSIVEAASVALGSGRPPSSAPRDPLLTSWRAQLEGPRFQSSGPETVLGQAGFADDRAPREALVAVDDGRGALALGPGLGAARRAAGRRPGRNSTVAVTHPLAVPEGEWALTLQTTWVEPAYLEPDASWCRPGGPPADPLANGGAFGGKRTSPVPHLARQLADEQDRTVRVLWSRDEVVRRGPKRPPLAVGLRPDGSGLLRLAAGSAPAGALDIVADRIRSVLPDLDVEVVGVPGPPTSGVLRRAGWAEAAVRRAALDAVVEGRNVTGGPVEISDPAGGRAAVAISADGRVEVEVWAGDVLDEVTLRSYCVGAVHQALGWVRHEGIAVDEAGDVQDLTIRSYGILPARDMPPVEVTVRPASEWPVNGSDAVFAATAAAAWLGDGLAPAWPTRRGPRP